MIKHPAKKTIYLRRIAQKERRIKLCRGYWRKPEIRRIRRRVVYKNVPRRVIRRVRTNSCSNLRTVILKLQGELLKTVDPKKKASIEKRIIKLELQTKGEKYLKELNDKHKRNKGDATILNRRSQAIKIWNSNSELRKRSRACFRTVVSRQPVKVLNSPVVRKVNR
jgi:hypothetical protein